MLKLSLLTIIKQLSNNFPSILQIFQPSILLFVIVSAFGLQIKQLFVQFSVLFIQDVMAISFLQQSLSLQLEILLGDLGFLFFYSFLSLEMFLGNVWIFFETDLIVFLSCLELIFYEFFPTSAESLQLTIDFLFLQFLAVLFNGQLLFQTSAGIELPSNKMRRGHNLKKTCLKQKNNDNFIKIYQSYIIKDSYYQILFTSIPFYHHFQSYLCQNEYPIYITHGLFQQQYKKYNQKQSQMQRIQFNPDIEIKFEHLLGHMNEKNAVISEFISILREICDTEIFYSRTLDKFANSISKLMIGKDPLKEVFIIFERIIAAKSEQSMEMANNIKDDMLPFIQKNTIDIKEQSQLKAQEKLVKDLRLNMQRKIKHLNLSQLSYKRSYEHLKKFTTTQTRSQIQQKQKLQKFFNQREESLIQTINIYNNTIEQYLLNYTNICQKLSQIQTQRKLHLRDSINKYMIFQISYIKNLQYNIPRYMQSLGKMNDKLIIQDRIQNHNENRQGNHADIFINLAKISINNYISNLSDKEKMDVTNSHKKILEIKKNYDGKVSLEQYQVLVEQLYRILDEAIINSDVRILKEVVYFSKNVYLQVEINDGSETTSITSLQDIDKKLIPIKSITSISQNDEKRSSQDLLKKHLSKQMDLFLLDAIMCHRIFQVPQFWNRYKQKLFDIIQKQGKKNIDSQSKEIQISLNFIAADLQFLKIINHHKFPQEILSNFTIKQQNQTPVRPSINGTLDKQFQSYLQKNIKYL